MYSKFCQQNSVVGHNLFFFSLLWDSYWKKLVSFIEDPAEINL